MHLSLNGNGFPTNSYMLSARGKAHIPVLRSQCPSDFDTWKGLGFLEAHARRKAAKRTQKLTLGFSLFPLPAWIFRWLSL